MIKYMRCVRDAGDPLKDIWNLAPNGRATAADCLKHPFLTNQLSIDAAKKR